jgi:hypothetical protein
MVTLPYTVASIGHKAFYQCNSLKMVVFESYRAPILEEEFDARYYESFAHIPGSGDYGNYTDYEGNEVPIKSMGLIPYFMWNATEAPCVIYYGANFVDYVGRAKGEVVMVRPSNGLGYGSFIFDNYFGLEIEGAAAADETTLAAIDAINAIPETVTLADRALVEAARAAYEKISSFTQRALVTNLDKLLAAEQRISDLDYIQNGEGESESETDGGDNAAKPFDMMTVIVIALGGALVIMLALVIVLAILFIRSRRSEKPEKKAKKSKKDKKKSEKSEDVTQDATDSVDEEKNVAESGEDKE